MESRGGRSPRDSKQRQALEGQWSHRTVSLILFVVVGAYAVAVVAGWVAPDNRLGAVELVLIGASAIGVLVTFYPQMIDRIRIIELGSVKLELLELKNAQTDQQRALDELRLVLSIMLPAAEQAHLRNLLLNETAGYVGRFAVRTELGHLQSLNLIRIRPNRSIEALRGGRVVDLSDYVELTALGGRAAHLIQDAERGGDSVPAN
jgi:hypothetical protein